MAETQDEEQWLYGDDKGDGNVKREEADQNKQIEEDRQQNGENDTSATAFKKPADNIAKWAEKWGEPAEEERQANGEESQEPAPGPEEEGSSSSDDEGAPAVTIGKLLQQPDVVRPPPTAHRAAPTSGLTEEDFNSAGKVNGIPVAEIHMHEYEDKPWRKPGADLADYFNYGFTEETWVKYCERQKSMRVHESEAGLANLGVSTAKGVAITQDKLTNMKKPFIPHHQLRQIEINSTQTEHSSNPIQVMTAEKRVYSSKFHNRQDDNMDFGGAIIGQDMYNTPPPSFLNPPILRAPCPWPDITSGPPPGWSPAPQQPAPPPAGELDYYEREMLEMEKIEKEMENRERENRRRSLSRNREPRRPRRKTRSKSRSRERYLRTRRSRSRSRSRSSSPYSRYKRKKL